MTATSSFVNSIEFQAALLRLQADNVALREVIRLLLQDEQCVPLSADTLDEILADMAASRIHEGLVEIEDVNPGLAAELQETIDRAQGVDAIRPPTVE
jgi:hypothetical protein